MTIIHVVDTLAVGGAEVLVLQLCAMQLEAGHTPKVWCVLSGGGLAAEVEKLGIEVRIFGQRPGWRVLWPLLRALRRTRPAVVHCHNANATIMAAAVARLAGVPAIISTRHGLVPPGEHPRREQRFWKAARFCDRVAGVCDVTSRNLQRGPGAIPDKIVTVRNGAQPAQGTPAATVHEAGKPLTVIHVARLNPAKDPATLLRAFAILRRRVSDALLWIVGDGALRGELESLARELGIDGATTFFGERRDVGALLGAADVFVLSSVSEGVPVSLLEAMAAGLPPVVTTVGGMPEIINLCGVGKAVPPGDPEALAAAIESFHTEPSARTALGEAARRCYAAHLSAGEMSRAYERLYAACPRLAARRDG